MAMKLYSDSDIQDIADAIRAKNGSQNTYTVSQMAAAITAIPSGGGISVDDIAQNLEPSGVVTLGSGVTSIQSSAFYNKPITSLIGENVTSIGASSLRGTRIVKASFPKVTNFGDSALNSQTYLQTLNLPNQVSNLGGYAIRYCSSLKNIILPRFNGGFGGFGLEGDTALELIDYGIATVALNNLPSCPLHTLILRKNTVQALTGNLSQSTAFKSGGSGGHVYIPEVLYNHLGDGTSLDYKSATNWATYDTYGTIIWDKLEGSPYESVDWGNNL